MNCRSLSGKRPLWAHKGPVGPKILWEKSLYANTFGEFHQNRRSKLSSWGQNLKLTSFVPWSSQSLFLWSLNLSILRFYLRSFHYNWLKFQKAFGTIEFINLWEMLVQSIFGCKIVIVNRVRFSINRHEIWGRLVFKSSGFWTLNRHGLELTMPKKSPPCPYLADL